MFYKKILMVSTVIFSSYMLSACSTTQDYRPSYTQNTYQQIPEIQPKIAFISEKTSTLPPYGYVQFCRDNPAECIDQNISPPQSSVLNNEITASTTASTSTASMSAADSLNPFNLSHNLRRLISNNPQEKQQFSNIIALLDSVNRHVNNNVTQVTDMDGFGVAENWRLPDVNSFVGDIGDCEDFALAKRKILIENYGFNRNALSMSVLRRPQGDVHAVLMVRTAYGDYVLDNLERDVLPWHKTGYQWLKKQAFGKPNQWVSL